jgi:YegS/Rv2252/BmrU family lipid kinase
MSWQPDKVVAVVNPKAAGGRVGRRWPSLRKKLQSYLGPIDFRLTAHQGHATTLASEAIAQGAEVVLALGGDGTLGAVAGGIHAAGGGTMGVLPAGTGGDFRRILRHGKNLFASAKALPQSQAQAIDLGRARYRVGNETHERVFLNVASFGMSGAIDRMVNASDKRLGRFSFLYATLDALRSYTPAKVRLEVDGEHQGDHTIFAVLLANARYAGGGMYLAPDAKLNDGLLDIIVVPTRPTVAALRLLPKVYSGRYLEDPALIHIRGRQLRAQCLEGPSPYVDVDGEAPGQLEADFTVLPGSLRMLDVASESLGSAP